jgi:hypothetical protein
MIIDLLANRSLDFTVFPYRNTSPYLLRPPQEGDTYEWYDIDALAYTFNRFGPSRVRAVQPPHAPRQGEPPGCIRAMCA